MVLKSTFVPVQLLIMNFVWSNVMAAQVLKKKETMNWTDLLVLWANAWMCVCVCVRALPRCFFLSCLCFHHPCVLWLMIWTCKQNISIHIWRSCKLARNSCMVKTLKFALYFGAQRNENTILKFQSTWRFNFHPMQAKCLCCTLASLSFVPFAGSRHSIQTAQKFNLLPLNDGWYDLKRYKYAITVKKATA